MDDGIVYLVMLTAKFEDFRPGEHEGTLIAECTSAADAAMVAATELLKRGDEVLHIVKGGRRDT